MLETVGSLRVEDHRAEETALLHQSRPVSLEEEEEAKSTGKLEAEADMGTCATAQERRKP